MDAPLKFRKKPVVIEALQWTGYNYTASEVFTGEALARGRYEPASPDRTNGWHAVSAYSNSAKIITTLEGEMRAQPGDWIIKGVKGECYPCRQDIFAETYDCVII